MVLMLCLARIDRFPFPRRNLHPAPEWPPLRMDSQSPQSRQTRPPRKAFRFQRRRSRLPILSSHTVTTECASRTRSLPRSAPSCIPVIPLPPRSRQHRNGTQRDTSSEKLLPTYRYPLCIFFVRGNTAGPRYLPGFDVEEDLWYRAGGMSGSDSDIDGRGIMIRNATMRSRRNGDSRMVAWVTWKRIWGLGIASECPAVGLYLDVKLCIVKRSVRTK